MHKTSHMTDLQYSLCVLVFTVVLMSTLNSLYSVGDYENMKDAAVHILDEYPVKHDDIEESIRSLYGKAANYLREVRHKMNYPEFAWGNRSILEKKYDPKDGGNVVGTFESCRKKIYDSLC